MQVIRMTLGADRKVNDGNYGSIGRSIQAEIVFEPTDLGAILERARELDAALGAFVEERCRDELIRLGAARGEQAVAEALGLHKTETAPSTQGAPAEAPAQPAEAAPRRTSAPSGPTPNQLVFLADLRVQGFTNMTEAEAKAAGFKAVKKELTEAATRRQEFCSKGIKPNLTPKEGA